MKAETTRTVAPRAIMPLFFVHSTLRNFILCFHLPPVCFQSSLSILLLVRVTLWKLAWYYHNRRPAARSCTALPRLLRTLIHAHSFTLHFSHFTSYYSPCSFIGDSSHSSSRGDADSGLVDDDPRSPGVFRICLGILRRSTNTLRPMTNAKTARTTIVASSRFIPDEVVELDPVA